jgi:hypothetical protein
MRSGRRNSLREGNETASEDTHRNRERTHRERKRETEREERERINPSINLPDK